MRDPLYSDFSLGEYVARYTRIRTLMEAQGIDALLLSSEENLRYFTGYQTIYWMIKFDCQLLLLTRDPSVESALLLPLHLGGAARTSWVEDVRHWSGEGPTHAADLRTSVADLLRDTLREKGLDKATIGMELGSGGRLGMSQVQFEAIKATLPDARIVDACNLVWQARTVKSPAEVAVIKTGCRLTCAGYKAGLRALHEGMSEREVALTICSEMLPGEVGDAGSRHPWMLIIQSGPRESWCDAVPSDYRLKRGDLMLLDGGAIYKGYHSDIIRMATIGEPTAEQKRMYAASVAAVEAAIAEIRPGATCGAVYEASDKSLRQSGFEKFVSERVSLGYDVIGHGVGLDIHELPILRAGNSTPLEPGMVLSVEVAVADRLPWAKARDFIVFEDMVLVTEDGHEALTPLEKALNVA